MVSINLKRDIVELVKIFFVPTAGLAEIGCRLLLRAGLLLCITFLFPLVQFFEHPVLEEPNRVSIIPDEFLNRNSVNSLGSLDTLLLPVDEDRHVFLTTTFLSRLLRGSQFSFRFTHTLNNLGLIIVGAKRC